MSSHLTANTHTKRADVKQAYEHMQHHTTSTQALKPHHYAQDAATRQGSLHQVPLVENNSPPPADTPVLAQCTTAPQLDVNRHQPGSVLLATLSCGPRGLKCSTQRTCPSQHTQTWPIQAHTACAESVLQSTCTGHVIYMHARHLFHAFCKVWFGWPYSCAKRHTAASSSHNNTRQTHACTGLVWYALLSLLFDVFLTRNQPALFHADKHAGCRLSDTCRSDHNMRSYHVQCTPGI